MASAEAKRLMRDVARRYRLMASIASKRGTQTAAQVSLRTVALPSN
jgi:hypothetical protein